MSDGDMRSNFSSNKVVGRLSVVIVGWSETRIQDR